MAGSKRRRRPDLATLGGLVVAALAILGGLLMEGGSLQDIAQHTALLIVLGGTMGAVMVHYPLSTLRGGVIRLRDVIFESPRSKPDIIEEVVALATKARRMGLISLEDEFNSIQDPFLLKALKMAVDGVDLADIDRVGHGIAVSFVATVYGVALANLLFLPAGNKIKGRARLDSEAREMMVEGVLAIVDGLNPKLIKDKLETYLDVDPVESGTRPSRQRAA